MGCNLSYFRLLAAVLALSWCLHTRVCHAVSYTVTIDTSPLATQTTPPAPFSLEFQLTNGGGVVNNTATLSGFNLVQVAALPVARPQTAVRVAIY